MQAAGALILMLIGFLQVAYSSELFGLLVGWEVVSLGLWLALRPAGPGKMRWLPLALHAPGLVSSQWLCSASRLRLCRPLEV